MAKLYFTYGPMSSQKTGLLLGVAHNYRENGGNVLLTKPSVDTKGSHELVSRMGVSLPADFLTTPDMDVRAEVLHRRRVGGLAVSALLVDEVQFVTPAQVDQMHALAVQDGVPVMTWGLRTDFRTHAFPASLRLFEIAHVLRESITMCGHGGGCEHRAQFNARQVNGLYVAEGGQFAIDGEDAVTYKSLCASHYLEDVGPIEAADS